MNKRTTATDIQIWESFDEHFDSVVDQLTEVPQKICESPDKSIIWSFERIKDILKYNATSGKRMRGVAVVSSYANIVGKDYIKTEDFKLALTLGWAIEIMQASFLVADDIMDQSPTRRGKPCWYQREEIGLQAINDSMVLESCVFTILKKCCRNKPYYADLVDLFREVILYTELGQSLDMETSEKPEVDFTFFTTERYTSIVKYKTSFYSFYLPVAIALYITGNTTPEVLHEAESILTEMGCYFQVQDDYIDVYGNPAITGKIGTDIESNKCSWLIVKALEHCTKEQREILQNNYGRKNAENKQAVLDVFRKIDVESIYRAYEDFMYNNLKTRIEEFKSQFVPNRVFLDLLNKIYKRKK